eukprot:Skav228526  [mRNA]  locus=scaffold796:256128:257240:+ [translate_table: standard]
MANFQYLRTFIDEQSHEGFLARSKSWPQLGGCGHAKSIEEELEAEASAYETGDLASVVLPHLRRGFNNAGIDGAEIIEMFEEEVASRKMPEVDAGLRRILKQMPLATLLGWSKPCRLPVVL